MFRNRQIIVKMDKRKKETTDLPKDVLAEEHLFEQRADHILHMLEGLGAKMFLGVCVYILLDTHRQVQVAKVVSANK